MKGIPSRARSSEVAQTILSSSGAKAEIANPEALSGPDDEHELFVAAWCAHPDLIPDEKIMAVPEPAEAHDGGLPLYLRPHEIIHDEVPALRVRLRIVEFQDLHTLGPSSDEDYGAGEEEDSDDSNYNGFHPGFGGGGSGVRPRTTQFASPDEPRLGRGSGPSFWARESRKDVWVGDVSCPVASPRGSIPCNATVSRIHITRETRVKEPVDVRFDFLPWCPGSPSSVRLVAGDPLVAEAALCTPRQSGSACDVPQSIDLWPRTGRSSRAARPGVVGSALDDDVELLQACILRRPPGPLD